MELVRSAGGGSCATWSDWSFPAVISMSGCWPASWWWLLHLVRSWASSGALSPKAEKALRTHVDAGVSAETCPCCGESASSPNDGKRCIRLEIRATNPMATKVSFTSGCSLSKLVPIARQSLCIQTRVESEEWGSASSTRFNLPCSVAYNSYDFNCFEKTLNRGRQWHHEATRGSHSRGRHVL